MAIDQEIEKLKKLDKRLSQAKARQEEYAKNEEGRLRKKRNHDLIVLGGVVCKYLGKLYPDEDDYLKLDAFLNMQESNGFYFTKFFNIPESKAAELALKRKNEKE